MKNVFLEILQNSQENACARASFLIKVQASGKPATLLKRRLWHRSFPVNFAKFLLKLFSKNTSRGCFLSFRFCLLFCLKNLEAATRVVL